jgi:hypothetical protein
MRLLKRLLKRFAHEAPEIVFAIIWSLSLVFIGGLISWSLSWL